MLASARPDSRLKSPHEADVTLFDRLRQELGRDNMQAGQTHRAIHEARGNIDETLLDAVISAAGEEQGSMADGPLQRPIRHRADCSTERSEEREIDTRTSLSPTEADGKRKRDTNTEPGDISKSKRNPDKVRKFENYGIHHGPSPRKKAKTLASLTPDEFTPETLAEASDEQPGQRMMNNIAPEPATGCEPTVEESPIFVAEYAPGLSLSTARAAGVYSAAALFRKPSNASKRYTRPPMSKLFASLQLSPENFLLFQGAAKSFMLDLSHPERQSCVGIRGRGDNDMVKLRLYHCVKQFLELDDNGEKFFGQLSGGAQERGWSWPRDLDTVVVQCTPLLRRMVTNERQRLYANDTRKSGASKSDTDAIADKAASTNLSANQGDIAQSGKSTSRGYHGNWNNTAQRPQREQATITRPRPPDFDQSPLIDPAIFAVRNAQSDSQDDATTAQCSKSSQIENSRTLTHGLIRVDFIVLQRFNQGTAAAAGSTRIPPVGRKSTGNGNDGRDSTRQEPYWRPPARI